MSLLDETNLRSELDDILADVKRLKANSPPAPQSGPALPPLDLPPSDRRFSCNIGYKVEKDWSTDKPDEPGYNAIAKRVGKGYRFMDWWRTNDDLNSGGGITDAQKALLDRQIDLCNDNASDLYLCLLFHDSPATIAWKINRVKARHHPGLKRYYEWANEPWNSGTNVHEELVRLTGPVDGRRPHIGDSAFQDQWAKFASRCFKAVKEADPDATTVLGCLTANPWIAKRIEARLTTKPDAHGLTFYFGAGLGGTPDPNTTVDQILASSLSKLRSKEIPRVRAHAAYSRSIGRRILGYEGGPHYTINPRLHTSHANVWKAMNQANRDPRITPLCEEMRVTCVEEGFEELFWFNFLTRYDQWGSWGLGETLDTIEQSEKYKYAAGVS